MGVARIKAKHELPCPLPDLYSRYLTNAFWLKKLFFFCSSNNGTERSESWNIVFLELNQMLPALLTKGVCIKIHTNRRYIIG